MKLNSLRTITLFGTFFLSSLSFSAETGTSWFGNSADGQWLVGIKTGTIENAAAGYDKADNTTVILGYQFSRPVGETGTSSIDLEIGSTNDDGQVFEPVNGHWDADTLGIFLTYRTPGTIYFKTKLGLLQTKVETRLAGQFPEKISDTNFAYGAGFGLLLGANHNVNLEVEWIGVSGDNQLDQVSFGGLVKF